MNINPQLRNVNTGQQSPVERSKLEGDKRGASIFVDSFISSTSHGHFVEGAARSLGSTGDTYQVNHHQVTNGRLSMPHAKALTQLQADFAAGQLSSESARKQIDSFVTEAAAGNVKLATSHLAAVEAEGFQNSVVNLSQGVDALVLMDMVKIPLGPNSKLSIEQQQQYSSNLQAAFLDSNEQVPNAELAVDQRLLKRVNNLMKESSEVQSAVAGWREGVKSFESGHNSVVVAAGNSGNSWKALAKAGFELDGDEDFNLLAVPEVTTVGATVNANGGVALSSASSFGSEVDIITSGEFEGRFGTSYASPKVANVLRAAHMLRPDFTSEQAEGWVKEKLAESVELNGHTVGLLSSERGSYLLAALEKKTQGS